MDTLFSKVNKRFRRESKEQENIRRMTENMVLHFSWASNRPDREDNRSSHLSYKSHLYSAPNYSLTFLFISLYRV